MQNEKEDITTDFTDIKGTVKKYCEFDANKSDNLDKIHKFFKYTNTQISLKRQ